MCANYKPLTLEQARALGLPEIDYEYPDEVYPLFDSPLLFKSKQGLEWRLVNFGLIPKWAQDAEIAKHTYNARSETLLEKKSFKGALEKFNFGVIPVTEFYEAKYINGKAQRWGVRRKDGQAFYIAALYEITQINDQVIRSATMITMDGIDHQIMREFHEPGNVKRSVIIIPHHFLDDWLSLKSVNFNYYIKGFPVEEFECFYRPKTKISKESPQLNFFD